MGAVTIDSLGNTGKVSEFTVADFDDKDGMVYQPAKVLHTFSAQGAYESPLTWTVMVSLAEKDAGGGFADFLQRLFDAVKADLQVILASIGVAAGAWVGAQVGGAFGSAVAGPLGTVIGALAGMLVGALVAWIINAFRDDVFEPQGTTLALPSGTATFANGALTSPVSLYFRGHDGEYVVQGQWRIVR